MSCAAGHDAVWADAWSRDPGDDEILARAYSGIIRLTGLRSVEQDRACVPVLERYGAELASSAVVTVEVGRVRIRPKEGRESESGYDPVPPCGRLERGASARRLLGQLPRTDRAR